MSALGHKQSFVIVSAQRLLPAISSHSPNQIHGFNNEVSAGHKSIVKLNSLIFWQTTNNILTALFKKVIGGRTSLVIRPHCPFVN